VFSDETAKSSNSQEILTVVGDNWSMKKFVVHIHDNPYILPHQQLPYFISHFNGLLKLTIIIHQHFHLLSSIVFLA
jgi:hypothetical protein